MASGGLPRFKYNGTKSPPVFEMEHLASFVSKGDHPLSPDKASIKLKEMELRTGCLKIHCFLTIDAGYLQILMVHNKEIMEQFPLEGVRGITYRMAGDTNEDISSNLVMFSTLTDVTGTVGSTGSTSSSGHASSQWELHIFNCIGTPANTAVEILREAQEEYKMSPLPQTNPPQLPSRSISQQDLSQAVVVMRHKGPPVTNHVERHSRDLAIVDRQRDSTLSNSVYIQEDRAERQYYLLNRCFDDIDRFVGRIQVAAIAFRELEHRQKRPSKKGKGFGDNMLTIRARLPSEDDFVDILKKFKLSFNLLACLQSRIEDPSAAELVHLIMQPLGVVVAACREPYPTSKGTMASVVSPGEPDLAPRVVAPVLTRSAVYLLEHCLTAKEMQLWRGLGSAWTTPRDDFTSFVPSYSPSFSDGFVPDPEDYDTLVSPVFLQNRLQDQNNHVHRSVSMSQTDKSSVSGSGYRPQSAVYSAVTSPSVSQNGGSMTHNNNHFFNHSNQSIYMEPTRQRSATSPPPSAPYLPASPPGSSNSRPMSPKKTFASDAERKEEFVRTVIGRRGRLCEVLENKTGSNHKELTVSRGEVLEILDDRKKWWKMRNSYGEEGHCPYTLLRIMEEEESYQIAGLNQQTNGTIQDKSKSIPSPVAPPPVSKKVDRRVSSKKKESPRLIPDPIMNHLADELNQELKMKLNRASTTSSTGLCHKPSNLSNQSLNNSQYTSQQRLVHRNDTIPEVDCANPLVFKKLKNYPLSVESSTNDVIEWLRVKEFSETAIHQFPGVTGKSLFQMSRQKMESLVGVEEAQRLFSLVKVQKTRSGYNTMSGRELQAILQRRKLQSEYDVDDPAAEVDNIFRSVYDPVDDQSDEHLSSH